MLSAVNPRPSVVLLLMLIRFVQGQTILAREGNIVVTSPHGNERQLTTLGRDFDPSASEDGRLAVFVRRTGETIGPHGPEQQAVSEIWIAETSGEKPAERLFAGVVTVNGREFRGFFMPKLSPRNQYVYFMINYAAATFGVVRLSRADHSVRFIAAALEFQSVPTGDWAGYLVLQQRRPYANGGFYYWYWLYDPDGKEIALVGPDQQYVKNFLAATR